MAELQVYWPGMLFPVKNTESAYLIGWQLGDGFYCVGSHVPTNLVNVIPDLLGEICYSELSTRERAKIIGLCYSGEYTDKDLDVEISKLSRLDELHVCKGRLLLVEIEQWYIPVARRAQVVPNSLGLEFVVPRLFIYFKTPNTRLNEYQLWKIPKIQSQEMCSEDELSSSRKLARNMSAGCCMSIFRKKSASNFITEQINSAYILNVYIDEYLKRSQNQKQSYDFGTFVTNIMSSISESKFIALTYPITLKALTFVNKTYRAIIRREIIPGVTLNSISLTARQTDYQLSCMKSLVVNYKLISWKTLNNFDNKFRFILFWNYRIDDVIFDLIEKNMERMVYCAENFKVADSLIRNISSSLLSGIKLWRESSYNKYIAKEVLMKALSLSKILGLTITLSIFSDLFILEKSILNIFYLSVARDHQVQLHLIVCLLFLFGGKRRNPLRNRIDSAEYSLGQLVIGTFIFILQIFLWPAIALYHIFFLAIKFLLIFLQIIMELTVATVNHFQAFSLIMWITGRPYLPATVKYNFCKKDIITKLRDNIDYTNDKTLRASQNNTNATYLIMRINSTGLKEVFQKYSFIIKRVLEFHSSLHIFKSIFFGKKLKLYGIFEIPKTMSKLKTKNPAT